VTIGDLLYLLLPSLFRVVDEVIRAVTFAHIQFRFRSSGCDNIGTHSLGDLYSGESNYGDEWSQ